MPSHQVVLSAVQKSGDRELEDWVMVEGEYAVSPIQLPGISDHALFEVIPGAVSHPMRFYLAVRRADGDTFVLTGQPAGLARLAHAESGWLESPSVARDLVRLLAPTSDRTWLVEDGAPLTGVDAAISLQVLPAHLRVEGEEVRMTLYVVDHGQRLQRWELTLPRSGDPRWTRTTLARGVGGMTP